MANEQNNQDSSEFNTSEGTGMDSAAEGQTNDQQPEGAKNKGTSGNDEAGSHLEGQYDKQSDNPTMHPSSADGK